MTRRNHVAALCLLACLSAAAGCSSIAPGSDPFVVQSERTIQACHDTARSFLRVENDNRAFVAAHLPAVHTFAEGLRAKGPDGTPKEIALTRAALDAVDAYKATRAAGEQAKVNDALSAVETVARQAREYLGKILAAKRGG